MAPALTWSLLGLAVVLVGVFSMAVYRSSTTADAGLSRYGLRPRRTTATTGVALFAAAAIVVFRGDIPALTGRTATVVGLWTLLLVVGANALAAAVGFARRWRAFHPESLVPTGAVSPGPVAVSGTATDEATVDAPVTGREACCFLWNVAVEDPSVGIEMGGTGDYREVAAEPGGTTFAVDDGSGPVRVDPDGARLDLAGERTVELPAGESLPRPHTDAASDVEFDHGDSARRYTEWVAAPGDSLSIAGAARRRDGRLVLTEAVVTTGSLTATAEEYRARTLLYALAGFGGVVVALWGLLVTV